MVGRTGAFLLTGCLVAVFIGGCARHSKSLSGPTVIQTSRQIGYASYADAGRETYRYAFSGQILDERTKEPVPRFSIELVGDDPAISSVLNQLGDERGLFHISRVPATEALQFATAPVIISASGYEPFVQMVDLGSDCLTSQCPGMRPTPFFLKALPGTLPPTKPMSPKRVQEIISQKGIPGLFKELINLGKWDSKTRTDLSQARNAENFSSVVVFLRSPAALDAGPSELNAIFKDGDEKKLSKLPLNWTGRAQEVVDVGREHREVANSLLSAGELLPYLNGVSSRLSPSEGGPLAGLVQRFLTEKNTSAQLAAMVVNTKSEVKPELAMASLMPLLQGWMTKAGNADAGYSGILNEALSEPATMDWLAAAETRTIDDDVTLFVKYLQPLVQGFVGKHSKVLMQQFDRLVSEDGLKKLRDFEGGQKAYADLEPYLAPLVRGLKSVDGKRLTQAIYPILQRKDPALVIRNIIVRLDSMESDKRSRVISTLFPSAGDWAREVVPAKQIFASQILSGVFFGEFKEVRVTQDLKGARAVVVSAQARDLFKLTMFPNVEKIVILHDK